MTKALWRIAAVTPDFSADELDGIGASIGGGRWNSPGTPLLYCSGSIALAVLETLAHLQNDKIPANRYLVRIGVPSAVWRRRMTLEEPPVGWDAQPHGKPSLIAGDAWSHSFCSALLQVPSVIVPEEFNVLINPLHADAAGITVRMIRKWQYDFRFF